MAGPAAGIALTILVAGCGPAANDPAVGEVSANETRALNEAAAMLDENGPGTSVGINSTGNRE